MPVTTSPTCRHFGRCGGCSLLTIPIGTQLAHKHARARALLHPFLGEVELVMAPVPEGAPRFDRTKLLYPVQPDGDGVLHAGLFATGTHQVVEIQECAIQALALTELAQRCVAILRARGMQAYDERVHRGWLRALHARIAAGTGELIVGLVTTDATFALESTIVPQLVEACADLPVRLVGLVQNVNPKPGNFLLGPTTRVLHGRDHIFDRQDGLTFKISFPSFYQVHGDATAILYRPAMAMLGAVEGLRVVDGYGGVGTFALRVAAAGARRVELVESSASACADATAAATLNGLADRVAVVAAPFSSADLEPTPDVLIVDPPRAGLGAEGVERVRSLAADRLLYVSCSAESLARDLAGLVDGYTVRAARLCDLFPHTAHSEVVLRLERTAS